MIFHLQCAVGDLAASCKSELEEVFSRLIDADRAGRHFFVSRRELCLWAVENLPLAGRERTHLVSISKQYATRGGLLASARGFADVVIGDSRVVIHGENRFLIGHKALIEGEYLLRSTGLVVEDVEIDGRVYGHVLNEARGVFGGPSLSLEPIHGGGATTARVFCNEIDRNRVVVCIVDHDRMAPMDKASSTARKILRIYRRRNEGNDYTKRFIGVAVTTIGREAENMIPYHVVKSICRDYRHFEKLDEILARERGDRETENDFWQYFDIKNGINGKKLRSRLEGGSVSVNTVCWISHKVGCGSEEIEHVCLDGFGQNILQRFLEDQDARRRFQLFARTECWRERFGGYLGELLWFFAAPNRSRT